MNRLAKRPSSFVLLALVIGLTAFAGCGGSDKGGGGSGDLGVNVNADPFAGPAPLAVRFTSSAKNPSGNVRYHWRFEIRDCSRGNSIRILAMSSPSRGL